MPELRDVPAEERNKAADSGAALPDGSFPIANCSDLANAVQAIGRAKDPAKAKAHIRKRKNALGCPEVELPESFALTIDELRADIAEAQANGQTFLEMVLRQLLTQAMTGKPESPTAEELMAEMAKAMMAPIDGVPDPSGQPEPSGGPPPTSDPADGYEGVTHAGLAVQAADTGRVLLIQRSLDQEDPPEVQGTWEFPGGGMEGDEDPEAAARREFCEEVGCPVPDGEVTGGWRSANGVYQGFVLTVSIEREAFDALNPETAHTPNPDDPQRRKPDVAAWFSLAQIKALGPNLRPEVHDTDWSQFSEGGGDHAYAEPEPEEAPMPEMTTAAEQLAAKLAAEDAPADPQAPESTLVPWHGVLTVEGKRSGDGRGFRAGAMRTRPLPLPLGWQKFSDSGHKQSVTVARIDQEHRVPTGPGTFEIRSHGVMLQNPEADEVIGLIGAFGKFGVSVDADDATMESDPSSDEMWFSDARSAGASIVAIPAFHEAWVALGPPPEDFYDGGEPLTEITGDEPDQALVAAAGVPVEQMFVDIAPGVTEDGPGWLTHPVDTDRLRDYWVSGPGAIEQIQWGVPGDFERCRTAVAEFVKPEYLSGYCANRHKDALGVWPGQEANAADTLGDLLTDRTAADILNLVAAGPYSTKAPHEWFEVPETDGPCPLTITDEGQVYGHVAIWGVCHLNVGAYGKCFLAPHSPSGYAHFRLGEVHTDKGSVPVGALSIGGGHAGPRLGLRPAQDHYDSTSTAFAHVSAIDGEHGVWVCGWVPPGTPEELVIAARASKLSGDWRHTPHGLDMVAALAVNVPGYEVPRIAAGIENGEVMSLVAAGVVANETDPAGVDVDALALAVAVRLDEFARNRATIEQLTSKFTSEEASA